VDKQRGRGRFRYSSIDGPAKGLPVSINDRLSGEPPMGLSRKSAGGTVFENGLVGIAKNVGDRKWRISHQGAPSFPTLDLKGAETAPLPMLSS
jgi:hypothetical protein